VILKRHGSPLDVAGRFQTSQDKVAFGRTWIGPVLFPIYVRVLGISWVAAIVIRCLVIIGLWALGEDVTVEGTLSGLAIHMLVQSAIITAIFAAVQANEARLPDGWVLGKKTDESEPGRSSRVELFVELALLLAIFMWLLSVWTTPSLQFDPLPDDIQLAPIWQQIYVPLILFMLAEIVQVCISLFKPEWTRFRLWSRVINGCVWLVFMGFLLTAGEWIVFTDTSLNSQNAEAVNQWFFYCLVITAVVSVGITLWDVVKLVRSAEGKGRMVVRSL
jgi:hypothetical protein